MTATHMILANIATAQDHLERAAAQLAAQGQTLMASRIRAMREELQADALVLGRDG
jgi:hypothetical protein